MIGLTPARRDRRIFPIGPYDRDMELSEVQVRVLGSLMEKAATTPDQYPLTTKALVTACNQRSNRDPVVDYDERAVTDAIYSLRNDYKLARSVTGSGRTVKHRHIVHETLGLTEHQQALLAVLALRGAQTPGELRARTERYVTFADLDDVTDVLESMATGTEPLVVDLGRGPGQSQNRWTHLLCGEPVINEPSRPSSVSAAPRSSSGSAVAELTRRVEALESRLATLEAALGLDAGEPGTGDVEQGEAASPPAGGGPSFPVANGHGGEQTRYSSRSGY